MNEYLQQLPSFDGFIKNNNIMFKCPNCSQTKFKNGKDRIKPIIKFHIHGKNGYEIGYIQRTSHCPYIKNDYIIKL